jgi:hypothetical protein
MNMVGIAINCKGFGFFIQDYATDIFFNFISIRYCNHVVSALNCKNNLNINLGIRVCHILYHLCRPSGAGDSLLFAIATKMPPLWGWLIFDVFLATKMPPLRGWMIPVVCHCYKDAAPPGLDDPCCLPLLQRCRPYGAG